MLMDNSRNHFPLEFYRVDFLSAICAMAVIVLLTPNIVYIVDENAKYYKFYLT